MDGDLDKVLITEKRSQVGIHGKRIFRAPNGSQAHDPPKYGLDVLTTELWETRGERGHIVGSLGILEGHGFDSR